MDNIFRVFMFILPYAICIAAYLWVGKKALRVPQTIARVAALIIVAGGLGYTVYNFIKSVGNVMTNDNFEYIILIVMVAVLAFASIVMTIGEPEEENKKTGGQGIPNAEEKANGL